MEFVYGKGMENQLLNCLLANLIGLGKQFFPQGQVAVSKDGQGAFFDILSRKMGGTEDMSSCLMPAGVVTDDGGAAADKGEDNAFCPVAASLDTRDISILVSSLISAMEQPAVTDSPADVKDADLTAITDFLRGVLEVLSGGDEVELASSEDAQTASGRASEEKTGNDTVDGTKHFAGQGWLASVLLQLERMNANSGDSRELPVMREDAPVEEARTPQPPDAKTQTAKGGTSGATPQTVIPEDQAAPVFVVEVVKAARKALTGDTAMKRNVETQAAVPVAQDEPVRKEDFTILSTRRDLGPKDGVEPEKIVIRVKETKETEVGEDSDTGENLIVQHNDTSRHGVQHASSETKGVVKNDFGAMMVDKIEKLTEQFAGKSMNMDMTVKLKIGDNETVLVGLRDEGSRVTVEVRTANENTMNFLQSQKEELIKSLESKNILTTIHVDIDQDAQGQRQQRQQRRDGGDDTGEKQDFGAFFEALA
ncbi:MAG TPA: hypothetical protein DDZ40_03555 [Deltaproteobacteria bacterium]|nr:hypothetical protein [Deltaproteobacteria bacterium]